MKNIFIYIILLMLLTYKLTASPPLAFCRYEDGFYECKGIVINGRDKSEKKLDRIIIEIEGCLLKQIVSINDEAYKKAATSRIEIDDSGIIEVMIVDQKCMIQIGKEITLIP